MHLLSGKGSIVTKHLQSGLSTMVVLLIAWVGVSLSDLQQNAAGTAVAVDAIKDDIRIIKLQNLNSYPKDEAQREWGEHKNDYRDLAKRVHKIEVKGT